MSHTNHSFICVTQHLRDLANVSPHTNSMCFTNTPLIHMCDVTFRDVTNVSPHIISVCYGVATISRLLKFIGLFCKRALWKRRYSAKETYNFKEPTNRSHPIWLIRSCVSWLIWPISDKVVIRSHRILRLFLKTFSWCNECFTSHHLCVSWLIRSYISWFVQPIADRMA